MEATDRIKGGIFVKKVIGVVGGASGGELAEHLQQKGYQVALVAGKDGESGTDIAEYISIEDLRNVEQIDQFFNVHCVRHIIIGTGHRVAFQLAEQLGQRGYIFNIDIQASLTAKQKNLYKDLIRSKGFSTPAYTLLCGKKNLNDKDWLLAEIEFPCVVKSPIDTVYPQKVSDCDELMAAAIGVFNSGSSVLLEQFIQGIEVTVPVSVTNNSSAKACGVCYYSKSEECRLKGFNDNRFIHKKLSKEMEDRVQRYCEELAIASGFEGLPRFDVIVTPEEKIYVLEANSVTVTGLHTHQIEFSEGVVAFFKEQGMDLAEIVVNNALNKFEIV